MPALLLVPLRLTFIQLKSNVCAAATSQLSIDLKDNKLCVQNFIEAEGSKKTDIFTVIESPNDWRFVIDDIDMQGETAYCLNDEFAKVEAQLFPQDIVLEGIANHATELIAYAWAGRKFLQIATALAVASDEQLIALRERVGSFMAPSFVQQILSVHSAAHDIRIPFDLLVRRAHKGPIDLLAMQSDADALAKITRAEYEARYAHDEWNIAPFKNDIEYIVKSWRRTNYRISNPMPIGVNAAVVENYVVRWVIDKQCLPRDKHRIKYTSESRKEVNEFEFEVDFDSLLARNEL